MQFSVSLFFAALAFTSSVSAENYGWCDAPENNAMKTPMCYIDYVGYGCAVGSCENNIGKPCSGGDGYYKCPE
ncbi:uncharacterized protein L3040_004337 [Drepanopeziza brunnea f. sp. 'multigermtubi']|uniref:uncharacterized protein n=1 Tax=Drepanopeziza brunnea f. sp. 'multigermtubi' TaxID=698441 RepID=UPI00239D534A|nr:hypothetical protein L3040_004337 [Drepanopeziza brunnea f. sp. 'multigermtubi']